MPKALKWTVIALAGVLALAAVAVAILVAVFDWNWLRGPIADRASAATGRDVSIDGEIDGELSLKPLVRITGIRVENAEWAKSHAQDMAEIERIEFRVDLLELLTGELVLPEVSIDKAKVFLRKKEDEGTPNWQFGTPSKEKSGDGAMPDERSEFPVIDRLWIDDSRVDYADPADDVDVSMKVDLAKGKGGEEETVQIEGEGTYRGKQARIKLAAGALEKLRESDDPYPFDLEIDVGETLFDARGTATEPLNLDGLDVELALSGPDLARLFPVILIPFPPTAEYSLSGRLKRTDKLWSFENFEGRVGESDLSGDLTVDTGPEVPYMEATLTSRKLHYRDLGGFIGAPPGREIPTKGAERVLPDMQINLERLRAMNMRVDFSGEEIIAPNTPINGLETVLLLENGVLTLEPLELDAAGGNLAGRLVLDGSRETPRVQTWLDLKSLALKRFLGEFDMGDLTSGTIGGRVELGGSGNSLAEALGRADGRVTLAMTGGSLDPTVVELIGLDIGEALAVTLTEEKDPVQIRCMLSDMVAEDGTLKVQGLVLDTTDSLILGSGSIDLEEERLDLRVKARPKDVSLLSANAPVAITGTMRHPEIAIDTLNTEDEGGLPEAIGKIVNPILALLPFVDLGLGEDADCRELESIGSKARSGDAEAQPETDSE